MSPMSRYTHTTTKGVRVSIDADGYVWSPDADGTPDQLLLGRVRRDDLSPGYWTADDQDGGPIATDDRTRRDALSSLLDAHSRGVVSGDRCYLHGYAG